MTSLLERAAQEVGEPGLKRRLTDAQYRAPQLAPSGEWQVWAIITGPATSSPAGDDILGARDGETMKPCGTGLGWPAHMRHPMPWAAELLTRWAQGSHNGSCPW